MGVSCNFFLNGGQFIPDLCPELNKSHAEIGRGADGCGCSQNLRRPATEIFELLAHELAAILLFESESDFDFPFNA